MSPDLSLVVTGVDADVPVAWLQVAGRTVDLIGEEEDEAMANLPEPLSPCEVMIVQLIGAGRSNRQVAEQMFISANTVKSYIRTAYQKIGVETRTEAVRWAIRVGLANAYRDHLGNREPLELQVR